MPTLGTTVSTAPSYSASVDLVVDFGTAADRGLLVEGWNFNDFTPTSADLVACVIDPDGASPVTCTAGPRRDSFAGAQNGGQRDFYAVGASVPTGIKTVRVYANNGDGRLRARAIPLSGATAVTRATPVNGGGWTLSITMASAVGALMVASISGQFDDASTFAPDSPSTLAARINTAAGSNSYNGAVLSRPGAASATISSTLTGGTTPGIWSIVAWSVTGAAPADTTAPAHTGSITTGAVTTTSIAYSWPAATDAVGVTGYERSLDGGTTWTAVGNVLTRTDTGLTAATAYSVRVRAFDAAGNRSTPALAATITTASSADTTPPAHSGSITPGASTESSIAYTWPAATDAVGVAGYERSLDGGSTWLSLGNVLNRTDSGLAAGTAYAVRVRAFDAAGNRSTPALAATISTSAAAPTPAPPPPNGTTGRLTSSQPLRNFARAVQASRSDVSVQVNAVSPWASTATLTGQTTGATGYCSITGPFTVGASYVVTFHVAGIGAGTEVLTAVAL